MEENLDNSETSTSQPNEVTLSQSKVELMGNKTIMCSVLFIDIVAYSKKSVSQQMELKSRLNNLLAAAIFQVPADDRIILDTGDGAAISFLGDVEDALRVSILLREKLKSDSEQEALPLPVRMGINLGPVRLINDINGQPNIVGDGINVAQRVMEFSDGGQILISRTYYDAISSLSHEYTDMLQYKGRYSDKHVREHEVYEVKSKDQMGQMAAEVPAQEEQKQGFFSVSSGRTYFLAGSILVGVLLLVTARLIKHEQTIPAEPATPVITTEKENVVETPAAIETIAPQPVEVQSLEQAEPMKEPVQVRSSKPARKPSRATEPAATAKPETLRPEESMAPSTTVEPATRIEEQPAVTAPPVSAKEPETSEEVPKEVDAADMSTVNFAITPWGEVYVDGRIRGISPPLTKLKVKPGNHVIEIRNKTFPSYTDTIQVKPGEDMEVRYKFEIPSK